MKSRPSKGPINQPKFPRGIGSTQPTIFSGANVRRARAAWLRRRRKTPNHRCIVSHIEGKRAPLHSLSPCRTEASVAGYCESWVGKLRVRPGAARPSRPTVPRRPLMVPWQLTTLQRHLHPLSTSRRLAVAAGALSAGCPREANAGPGYPTPGSPILPNP